MKKGAEAPMISTIVDNASVCKNTFWGLLIEMLVRDSAIGLGVSVLSFEESATALLDFLDVLEDGHG